MVIFFLYFFFKKLYFKNQNSKYIFFVLGKASLAGLFGERFSINEVKLLEVEEDTYLHLPHLYEKDMIVNKTPIELDIFDLNGTTDPRAVKSRLNIYPLAVRLYIFHPTLKIFSASI